MPVKNLFGEIAFGLDSTLNGRVRVQTSGFRLAMFSEYIINHCICLNIDEKLKKFLEAMKRKRHITIVLRALKLPSTA